MHYFTQRNPQYPFNHHKAWATYVRHTSYDPEAADMLVRLGPRSEFDTEAEARAYVERLNRWLDRRQGDA